VSEASEEGRRSPRRTFVVLENAPRLPLPAGVTPGPDVRFSESLVEHLLEAFTASDDIVFDPFAGFGTTLRVAEAMGRVPFGVELNERRCEYARSLLANPARLRHGDARQLERLGLPTFDFSLTSPPYMNRGDAEDPFTDYSVPGAGYERYLDDLRGIYAQMAGLMKPNARAVLEVANLKRRQDGAVTTLAWDVAAAVGSVEEPPSMLCHAGIPRCSSQWRQRPVRACAVRVRD